MPTIQLESRLEREELMDACECIDEVIAREGTDLYPAAVALLLELEEALAEALGTAERSRLAATLS